DSSSGQIVYTLMGNGSGTLSSCQLLSSSDAGGNWAASGTMTVTVSPVIAPGSVGVALGSYSAAKHSSRVHGRRDEKGGGHRRVLQVRKGRPPLPNQLAASSASFLARPGNRRGGAFFASGHHSCQIAP